MPTWDVRRGFAPVAPASAKEAGLPGPWVGGRGAGAVAPKAAGPRATGPGKRRWLASRRHPNEAGQERGDGRGTVLVPVKVRSTRLLEAPEDGSSKSATPSRDGTGRVRRVVRAPERGRPSVDRPGLESRTEPEPPLRAHAARRRGGLTRDSVRARVVGTPDLATGEP